MLLAYKVHIGITLPIHSVCNFLRLKDQNIFSLPSRFTKYKKEVGLKLYPSDVSSSFKADAEAHPLKYGSKKALR